MTSSKTQESVTADDVAALAGVSRWTVNRAFKKDSSISNKSKKRVLDAAAQLGYLPDLMAAGLASDRSNLVSVLIDDFANPYKLLMMEKLTGILRTHGWGTMLVNTVNQDDASDALLNASQRRVDAAILIGSQYDESVLTAALGARRVRKLIVFGRYSSHPDTISICCDDVAAVNDIADHVVERGYRRPVFLAGPQTPSAHLLRKETFIKRWSEKRKTRARFTAAGVYDPTQAYQHVCEYLGSLKKKDWPDVLVCENDAIAMGAIDAVRYQFGLSVPEDIAVTGFDDAPFADNPNYELTTYRQPVAAMAEQLVEVLQGKTSNANFQNFKGELVVRRSA